jgi:nucleoid-associated protein YgaU
MNSDSKKPDFSNVQSGAASTAPPPPPKPDFGNVQAGVDTTAEKVPVAEPEQRTYTVVKGDSLSKIARHFYGNAHHWRRIFEANRDQISNPDLIRPGQVLKIPDEPAD